MNFDYLRALCLSFLHATEKLQWEDELCFKVRGKIFAMVSLSKVPQRLIFKCDPEEFVELIENEGVVPAPYLGRYKWVMLETLDALTRTKSTVASGSLTRWSLPRPSRPDPESKR
jgi:predicted DNA-binding protein (MmcQ/YjbR family)